MTDPDPEQAATNALLVLSSAAIIVIVYDIVLYANHGRDGTISRGVWLYWQDHPGTVTLALCSVAAVFGGLVVHWLGW